MRENRPSGSMSGVWKRSGNHAATAPHLDSAQKLLHFSHAANSALPGIREEDFPGENRLCGLWQAGTMQPTNGAAFRSILRQILGPRSGAYQRRSEEGPGAGLDFPGENPTSGLSQNGAKRHGCGQALRLAPAVRTV